MNPRINCPLTNPFPHLSPEQGFTVRDLAHALHTFKPVMRTLLDGGPIRQPSRYWVFKTNGWDALPLRVSAWWDRSTFWDGTPPAVWIPPDRFVDFRQVAGDICSGRLPLPLVYKPCTGAFGNGIFFITGDVHDRVTLTMASLDPAAVDPLTAAGLSRVQHRPHEHLVEATVDPRRVDLVNILCRLRSSTCQESMEANYDPGMMEPMLPALPVKGRAFETRYSFHGDLATGDLSFIPADTYARIGSSAHFSNWTGRQPRAECPPADRMYEAFFAEYPHWIPPTRHEEFIVAVEALIRAEYRYALARLKAAGIELHGKVVGTFDQLWLAPVVPDGLPVPALTEAHLTWLEPDYGEWLSLIPNRP